MHTDTKALGAVHPTRTRRAVKAGIVICGVLGVIDLVSVGGLGSGDGPPAAVLILGAVLGAVTLIALPRAWRGRRGAESTVVASRVLSALTGVPALSADDVPDWAPPVVALSLLVTSAGVALIYSGGRESDA